MSQNPCRKEHELHSSHTHSHNHNHNHDHDHDSPENELETGSSLYKFIDHAHIMCMNESESNSGKKVFKQLTEIEKNTNHVTSDEDLEPELLFKIPFTSIVSLRSIDIKFHDSDTTPKYVKLLKDKEDIDFTDISDNKPIEQFNLVFTKDKYFTYFVKASKWNNTNHLSMFFYADEDETEQIRIDYIGLKGEFRSQKRKAVKTVYESKPMSKDHKTKTNDGGMNSFIS